MPGSARKARSSKSKKKVRDAVHTRYHQLVNEELLGSLDSSGSEELNHIRYLLDREEPGALQDLLEQIRRDRALLHASMEEIKAAVKIAGRG